MKMGMMGTVMTASIATSQAAPTADWPWQPCECRYDSHGCFNADAAAKAAQKNATAKHKRTETRSMRAGEASEDAVIVATAYKIAVESDAHQTTHILIDIETATWLHCNTKLTRLKERAKMDNWSGPHICRTDRRRS